MNNKPRRKHFPAEKAAIVRRHLADKAPVSTLAEELDIQPSQIHLWVKQVLDQADAAFLRSGNARQVRRVEDAKDVQIAQLQDQLVKSYQKLARNYEVVAELMAVHVQLEKEPGELCGVLERPHGVARQAVHPLAGLAASKFYDWRQRYGKVNEHNAAVPRDHWLEAWDTKAIVDYHEKLRLRATGD